MSLQLFEKSLRPEPPAKAPFIVWLTCHRVVITFLIVTTPVFLTCRKPRDTQVPEQLLGVWRSSDQRYEGRFFELTPTGIMRVGTGGENVDSYSIWNIEAVPRDALTLYTITYLNVTGEQYRFNFHYDPYKDGIIVFVNQDDMQWTRDRP